MTTTTTTPTVDLENLTVLEVDFRKPTAAEPDGDVVVTEVDCSEKMEQQPVKTKGGDGDGNVNEDGAAVVVVLPQESLVVVAETELVHYSDEAATATIAGDGDDEKAAAAAATSSPDRRHHRRGESTGVLASLSEIDFEFSKIKIRNWDRKTFYSDYIMMGLEHKGKEELQSKTGDTDTSTGIDTREKTIMLFETEEAKQNKGRFKFLNWPPPPPKSSSAGESSAAAGVGVGVLGPLRYACFNGSTLPAFFRHEQLPPGLLEHWKQVLPGFVEPSFVRQVDKENQVYAYLPVETIDRHVNDPSVHYHLAGKDAIHLMTQKTTRLLPDTKTVRPCVVKTTHSFGSKGIFIIINDQDEQEFQEFLKEAGDPTFVVTDFVEIDRNVACHFFMHPDGERVTWFGSNENKRLPDGHFSTDSYLEMIDQESLKHMQLPFVEEVVRYCHSLGFWGFCGIDVLFDTKGKGYLVDINPRVTGSCPALMTLNIFNKTYGFDVGIFRRAGDITYPGSAESLWKEVDAYNTENEGKSRIVVHSMFEKADGEHCRVNIGVYGKEMERCKAVLNQFAQ